MEPTTALPVLEVGKTKGLLGGQEGPLSPVGGDLPTRWFVFPKLARPPGPSSGEVVLRAGLAGWAFGRGDAPLPPAPSAARCGPHGSLPET